MPSCPCPLRAVVHAGARGERTLGFTLIEMMVVIGVVALMIGASSLAFHNVTRADLRSAAARTAGAMRFAFDRATMTGMPIRLAFDLDKGEVWLEGSEERVTLGQGNEVLTEREARTSGEEGTTGPDGGPAPAPSPKKKTSPMLDLLGLGGTGQAQTGEGQEGEGQEGEEQAESTLSASELAQEVEADLAPMQRAAATFTPLKGMLTKKIKMASGVRIEAVVTARMVSPVEQGMGYVYFFPQGNAEPAIIHLVNKSEDTYSVVLNPLTGQARVYPCLYLIPADYGVSDDKRTRKQKDPCAERGGL